MAMEVDEGAWWAGKVQRRLTGEERRERERRFAL